jgi:hypothetical protein
MQPTDLIQPSEHPLESSRSTERGRPHAAKGVIADFAALVMRAFRGDAGENEHALVEGEAPAGNASVVESEAPVTWEVPAAWDAPIGGNAAKGKATLVGGVPAAPAVSPTQEPPLHVESGEDDVLHGNRNLTPVPSHLHDSGVDLDADQAEQGFGITNRAETVGPPLRSDDATSANRAASSVSPEVSETAATPQTGHPLPNDLPPSLIAIGVPSDPGVEREIELDGAAREPRLSPGTPLDASRAADSSEISTAHIDAADRPTPSTDVGARSSHVGTQIPVRHDAAEAADVLASEIAAMLSELTPLEGETYASESQVDVPAPIPASADGLSEEVDAAQLPDMLSRGGESNADVGPDPGRRAFGVDSSASLTPGPSASERVDSVSAQRPPTAARAAASVPHHSVPHHVAPQDPGTPSVIAPAGAAGDEIVLPPLEEQVESADGRRNAAAAPPDAARSRRSNSTGGQHLPDAGAADGEAEKTVLKGKAIRASVPAESARSDRSTPKGADFDVTADLTETGQEFAGQDDQFFEVASSAVEETPEQVLEPDQAESDARIGAGRTDATADRTTATARSAAMPRSVVSAAWLRAMMDQGLRVHTEAEGWNSVTMRLGDDDGTMTVRTKREDGAMAVHVAFSDPTLRVLATQNAERLEAVLRQQYETSIDLSLSDSGAHAGDRESSNGPSPRAARATLSTEADIPNGLRRSPWARNEWVV